MASPIDLIEQRQLRQVPPFKAGDTVRVHFQVIEGQRRRVQVFEGIVIKRQGPGARETFTVRKTSFGVGVERTFPVHSPKIERIEVQAIGDVNTLQANLLDTTHGAEFFDLAEDFGFRIDRHNEDELTLPGASGPRLRYVRAGTSETSGKEGNQ